MNREKKMDIQIFKEKSREHAKAIQLVRECSSYISKNLNFLQPEDLQAIRSMRVKKQDIYWILNFLELAPSPKLRQDLHIFLMKCPNLQAPEGWVVEMARELQPKMPLCLLPVMFERSVDINKTYWRVPPTVERFLEVVADELQEIRSLAGVLQGSEIVFREAEKRWERRHGR